MDFLSYALSLFPSVLSIPRLGHLNTLDGYNQAVTVAGSPKWSSSFSGMAFSAAAIGHYSIAHGAEQFFTDQTVFIHFSKPYESASTTQYTACKVDGLGTTWLFAISSNYLYLYNSALASQNAGSGGKPMIGYTSCAFKSVGSSAIRFYQDGTLVDVNAGLDFSTQYASPITIGSYYTGPNQLKGTDIDCVAIFPSALSDETISNLHTSFDQLIVAPDPKVTYFIPEKDTKGAVIDLHGSPNANNIISDKSGNGNHGTVQGSLDIFNSGEDILVDSPGAGKGDILVSNNPSIDNLVNRTIAVSNMKFRSAGEGGGGRIFEWGSNRFFGVFNIQESYSTGVATWGYVDSLNFEKHFIYRRNRSDGSSNIEGWINGTPITIINITPQAGTLTTHTNDLVICNNAASGAGIRQADFQFSRFKVWPTQLSDDGIRDEYLKFALGHCRNLTPRFEHPVTLSAVSAPGHVGPWQTWAGSHEYLDDGVERYVKSSSANNFKSLNLKMGYGALYFKIYRGSGAGFGHIMFLLGERGDVYYTSSLQSGYMIFLPRADNSIALYKITSGVPVSIGNSGAGYLPSSGIYKFFISRRLTDGRFSVYTKEVNHSTWNLAFNSSADNSHTSGNYIQSYSRDALESREYDFLYWPYGDSLTPDDVDFIAD